MTQRRFQRAFGTVHRDVFMMGLPPAATTLYGLLVTYANGDGYCWMSNETLAADLGWSDKTVDRAMGALRDAGVVERDPRFKDGRQITSMTRLVEAGSNLTPRTPTSEDPEGDRNDAQNKTTMNKGRLRRTRTEDHESVR